MKPGVAAKVEEIQSALSEKLANRVDNEFTGVLKLEINISQGGISKVYFDDREELKMKKSGN